MIKLNTFTLLSAFSVMFLHGKAQEVNSNSFSLQQSIDYAYKNSPNYLNAQNDVLMAKYKRKEVIGMAMPQITGSVDMKNFIVVPTQVIPNFIAPAIYQGVLASQNPPIQPSPDDPKLDPGNYPVLEAQFGTRYQTTAGLNASLLVFSADYLVGLKATKEMIGLMNIGVSRTKSETVSAVSKAYYGVLVNRERIKLLEANMTKLEKLLNDTRAFNKQGFVEQIDVDRLEVAFNNLSTEKQKIERLIILSENVLKFQMGYTGKESLVLTDSLIIKDNTEIDASKIDVAKRAEYQMLETQQRLYNINVKRLKFGYLPTLVAYGSVSASGMGNDLTYVGYVNKYYQTQLIGATLSLSVFDGMQRHYKIQQAKLDFKKGENSMKNLQLAIELEGASAAFNYNNAVASLQTQKRNLDLAQNIYNVSQKKYEQGVGSNLEVINAQTSLKESETNYFNAVYDMLIYKIDYSKAIGTLVK
ncbi:MAG: TolC family protein [Bacteroidetes bacterium]|jgi:outer membrane protein TolC|nr:TolC family protein [Bacteroidota bacterium]